MGSHLNNNKASHSKGQSVAFDRMLKKYGSGWQTRMVRAQRSWCFQTSRQLIGASQHSATAGQSAMRWPFLEMRWPS